MMTAVPPAMATTILMGVILLQLAPDEIQTESVILAENFTRYHQQALAELRPQGPAFGTGAYAVTMAAPFTEIEDWESSVEVRDGEFWLVTWVDDYGAAAFSDAQLTDMIIVLSRGGYSAAYFGQWEPLGGNEGRIFGGNVPEGWDPFPEPGVPIPDNAPVLVSPL